MSSENKKNDLPTLLVIASTGEENWVKLCSEYSEHFRVIQTTWDKISLSSYSDQKYPVVTIYPNSNPLYPDQSLTQNNVNPSLVLVRNLARYLSSKLEIRNAKLETQNSDQPRPLTQESQSRCMKVSMGSGLPMY